MGGKLVRLLLIPVLAGLVASVAAYAALGQKQAQPAEVKTVKVLVARDRVEARTPLTGALFDTVDVPENLAGAAVTDPGQVEGRLLEAPLVQGQMLLAAQLVDQEKAALTYRVATGMRAVTISVDEFSGVAGHPAPGDWVDVILVLPEKKDAASAAETARPASSRLLFEQVRVLAKGPYQEQEQGKAAAAPGQKGLSSYTLALTPNQAVELALAEELGHFKLALRPADETAEPKTGQIIMDERRYDLNKN